MAEAGIFVLPDYDSYVKASGLRLRNGKLREE
jgi:hypothetical protein